MKERHLGCKLEPSKILRKTHKSWEQLRRHDPDVEISEDPTENLFVSNSSVLCGVSLEELEEIFYPFDEKATFTVFPNKRQIVLILPTGAVVEDQLVPKDLVLVENYITEEEEKDLLDLIFQQEDAKPLKHRAVIHYGYEFDYSRNAAVKPTKPIPPLINQLIDKLVADSHVTYTPDQVTINVYEPGQGIPSHYDTHSAFEDPIVCVSLCSDIVMEFKDGANSARIASVLLKRRSLCLLQGEARYRWKHGIVNRKHDIHPITHRVVPRQLRVSVTLRKIRKEPCQCPFKEFCDWDREVTLRKIRNEPCQCPFKEFCDWDREGEMSVPSDNKSALRIEGQYVNDVYENIAAHFDETRISGWTAVKK
ncbi:unnamed protein product [Cylicostephanus goldi]|uniref:Fe2OG dioxygenase domain-containing protein n=1 Tax=Cylicostephanus goldi TaxID=71465 RepID=A0A3P7MVJ0_CYLGO|nr:unnamed protein product [Cylicostephanus goldi]